MFGYAARRLIWTIPLLVVVSILCFALTDLLPGDPTAARLGQHYSKEAAAGMRREMGLDDPFARPLRPASRRARRGSTSATTG